MPFTNLAELLTGRALDIPLERLDMQGLVAAFRVYQEASHGDRDLMEISLADAILSLDNWDFIVDAVYLARSLRMDHELLRAAINSAALLSPKEYRDILSTEVRRYFRDVPNYQQSELPTGPTDASEAISDMSRFNLDSEESFSRLSQAELGLSAA